MKKEIIYELTSLAHGLHQRGLNKESDMVNRLIHKASDPQSLYENFSNVINQEVKVTKEKLKSAKNPAETQKVLMQNYKYIAELAQKYLGMASSQESWKPSNKVPPIQF